MPLEIITATGGAKSEAILSYAATIIALARDLNNFSTDDLAHWMINSLDAKGYFWSTPASLEAFSRDVATGRALIYDDVSLELGASQAIVKSKIWYADKTHFPDFFYYYDIEPNAFIAFARSLAEKHALKFGFRVNASTENNYEVLKITVL